MAWADDVEARLDHIRERVARDPVFRRRIRGLIRRYRAEVVQARVPSTAALDYFDATLESPRLRGLLDQAKGRAAARRADAD